MRARNLVLAGWVVATLIVLSSAGAAEASGGASTFTVSGFGDGPGTCTAPDANNNSVCTTLRGAVTAANKQSNDPTIELQAGTFQLAPGNGGQLDLATSMNIVGAGPGGPNGTTIQQTDGKNRVLEVDGSTTLSELEITGGHYTPPWSSGQSTLGGGILVLGVLSLESSAVTDNEAIGAAGPGAGDRGDSAQGGGIAYGASAPAGSTISDSAIGGNSALGGDGGTGGALGGEADGGGIAYQAAGPLAIEDSTISSNTATGGAGGGGAGAGGSGGAGQGGGIFDRSGISVLASTIADNTATGGAEGAGPTPSSSSSGSADGGGIFTAGAQPSNSSVVNSTIFDNAAAAGAATTGGSAGSGSGGGVAGDASELESDTFDANRASSFAGNLDLAVPNTDTSNIDDTIVAGGSPDNCSLSGGSPVSSRSYDLEDDAGDSCGFSAANHSLVGVDPQLPASLGANGGPTQTLAPVPGSPVLQAGGHCQQTVDQRGLPRSTPCDIGAFQGQPPANATPPSIGGKPSRGSTLICDPGVWTGDGSPTFTFMWLKNGVPIPAASTNTYVVGAADAGQGLACQVTASYYGSTKAASPFLIAPSYPIITLLSVSAKSSGVTVNLGCRGPDGKRCHGSLTVSVLEHRRGGRVVSLIAAAGPRSVTLGQRGYSLLTRHTAAIHIRLGRTVARLLRRFRRIPSLLSVSQTTGLGTGLVTSRRARIHRAPVGR